MTPTSDIDISIHVDAEELAQRLREVGDAFRHIQEAMRPTWAHIEAAFTEAFRDVYVIGPGTYWSTRAGQPIRTKTDALAALIEASGTERWCGRRIPKARRRYAKARYLECRRILGGRLMRDVSINQFLST